MVVISSMKPIWRPFTIGAPQELILGPAVFDIFIKITWMMGMRTPSASLLVMQHWEEKLKQQMAVVPTQRDLSVWRYGSNPYIKPQKVQRAMEWEGITPEHHYELGANWLTTELLYRKRVPGGQ